MKGKIDVIKEFPKTVEEAAIYYSYVGNEIYSDYLMPDGICSKLINERGKTIPELSRLNYLNALAWIETVIDRSRKSIKIISENSQDSFLELFGEKLEDKLLRGVEVKVIALGDYPKYLEKLKREYQGFEFKNIPKYSLIGNAKNSCLSADDVLLKIDKRNFSKDKDWKDVKGGIYFRNSLNTFDVIWKTIERQEKLKRKVFAN
jgi:sugar-specific transcriptional regulator TrmB